jgi:hypothetical protein
MSSPALDNPVSTPLMEDLSDLKPSLGWEHSFAHGSHAALEHKSFFLRQIAGNDVILLGTKHNQPCTTFFLMDLLPILAGFGVTHIGLEIATDQQTKIDKFIHRGSGLDEIDIFHVIDRPEYRCFLDVVRLTEIKPVALDLPRSMWKTPYTRDQWMAKTISSIFQSSPGAKILVVVGNLHTLKRIDWIDPAKNDAFIPGHLSAYEPDLDILSILADYEDASGPSCRIRGSFQKSERPLLFEARGLDLRPKILDVLASKPMKVDEVTDAVLMY